MSFCSKCGTDVGEAKFCPNCGNKIISNETDVKITEETTESVFESSTEEDAELIAVAEKKKTKLNSILSKILFGSIISAGVGIILFLGIVIVGLIGYGKVYLFGGYKFVKVLSIISMVFMLSGFAAGLISYLWGFIGKYNFTKKQNKLWQKIILIVLVVLSLGFSVWGFVDCVDNKKDYSSGNNSGSGGSYNNNYNSGVSKTIGLSLKVDRLEKSGSYTYVYCTVKNVSSKYVATRYRYVKVKGQFKNSSGQIVDTDSTYAVDGTWLEPGESKTFYFMVKNTNIKSATLSFVD